MRTNNIPLAFALTGMVASLSFTPAAAGGGETYILGMGGSQVFEHWAVPPGGVPWSINRGVGIRTIPGFPFDVDAAGATHAELPGIQSLIRAAEAWNAAEYPGVPGPASTFSMFTDETLDITSNLVGSGCSFGQIGQPPRLVLQFSTTTGCDDLNLVTAWEPECFWSLVGGPGTVALASVAVDGPTGVILESDVAFNTNSTDQNSQNAPYWSFVEYNDYLSSWCVSSPLGDGGVYREPVFGYVDLQGVATHEFGHFAGLAHSLVGGHQVPDSGTVPTMFEVGHTLSDFSAVALYGADFGAPPVAQMIDSANTVLGGLLGGTLSTLQQDDIHALATTYPLPPDPSLGRLEGTVVDSTGVPVVGTHVMAIGRFDGYDTRVGVLTGLDGSFAFEGMTPGFVYLYVEPVDAGGLFDPVTLPVFLSTGCGTASSCGGATYTECGGVSSLANHQIEFWDANESGLEASPMTATPIAITPGNTTTGIDFIVVDQADFLTVKPLGAPPMAASSRGLSVVPGPMSNPVFEFTARTSHLPPNTMVNLYVGPERVHRSLAGELFQAATALVNDYPIVQTMPVGSGSTTTFTLTVTDSMAHHNLLCQVVARTPSEPKPFFVTNPVNLYVEQP